MAVFAATKFFALAQCNFSAFRDGLQESNVVTRTFVVSDVDDQPLEDAHELVDSMFETASDNYDLESIDSYRPRQSSHAPKASTAKKKVIIHKQKQIYYHVC